MIPYVFYSSIKMESNLPLRQAFIILTERLLQVIRETVVCFYPPEVLSGPSDDRSAC